MISISKGKQLMLETIIGLGVISIIITIFMFFYQQLTFRTKLNVLNSELKNLKMSLQVYKYKNGKYPESLKELIRFFNKNETKLSKNGKYFLNLKINEEGYFVDPFGNKFIYNKDTATISAFPVEEGKFESLQNNS